MRQLYPFAGDVDPHDVYLDLAFPARPDRPHVVLNFVASVDGRVSVDGRASGLGSRMDRELMRQIRAAADALLVGAGTLRAEAIDPRVPPRLAASRAARGLPAQPMFVLITSTGAVPDRKLFHMADVPRLVLATRNADLAWLRKAAPDVEIVAIEEGWLDLGGVVGRLHHRGVRSIVCEGGPTLAAGLAAAGLVDEVFLTVAPRLVGGAGLRLLEGAAQAAGASARLDLVSVFEHEGELFLRYRLEGRQAPS